MTVEHDDAKLAPPDREWHIAYERWLNRTIEGLIELQQHPSFAQSEDLGDYVDCISTLLTFAPRTRDDLIAVARAGTTIEGV